MNAVKKDIEKLVEKKLAAADEKFPQFNSPHEGYAVTLEEYEEAAQELEDVKREIDTIWKCIKFDKCISDYEYNIKRMRKSAINAACEAIQVAAMCDKFMRLGFTERED